MDYLPLPQIAEPLPGLRNRVIKHTRTVLAAKLRTKSPPDVTNDDLDLLSIEELYGLSPCVDLLANPPADKGMDSMLAYRERVDYCLDEKGRNAWSNSIIEHIHKKKHPRRRFI